MERTDLKLYQSLLMSLFVYTLKDLAKKKDEYKRLKIRNEWLESEVSWLLELSGKWHQDEQRRMLDEFVKNPNYGKLRLERISRINYVNQ